MTGDTSGAGTAYPSGHLALPTGVNLVLLFILSNYVSSHF